ncbi:MULTISPECIES: hypothetical protein [Psychrilyobacter]|uniref:Uncharacterized protein n=2 Tax=Psychrilyobacter piezotolerans TaxID=2293438 RepID=A0ABX9KJK3_9FUSO|nr:MULTISPECIES: hypothetical protein [Psychrilyobacter]NDI76978.1 hypothetical protein [Psychrilyobacter piezotolerans]RDE64594.1 hypothetical protein DV867_03375 [Psychrilyobacter sp. S5]REI42406.1 hypothetical protein DYH56_03375 [Psychrilyobacter piezotolerans]
MKEKEFTQMMQNSERFKISSFETDRSQEKINILANSYVYSFSEPYFSVVSGKDPKAFREAILRRINTEQIMGVKLINIMETNHSIDLSMIKADY